MTKHIFVNCDIWEQVFQCGGIAIVPLYNGETAPKKLRGMLLVLYQLQIIIG